MIQTKDGKFLIVCTSNYSNNKDSYVWVDENMVPISELPRDCNGRCHISKKEFKKKYSKIETK